MISFFIVSFLLYCVVGSGLKISPSLFDEFKAKYKKSYSSTDEEQRRLQIFMSNMVKAEEMNRANPFATFGVNKFADLTEEEFKSTYANGEKYYKARQSSSSKNEDVITYTKEEVASSCTAIDWRKKGAVTAVKDQGHCGSCWAFSTTGGIEGQWFLAGHPLVSLSEQELVSCDSYDNNCNGGIMDSAFHWLIGKRNGQIVKETSLPYVSGRGRVPSCPANLDKLAVGAQIKGFSDIAHDEDQMSTFVCTSGPLSIAVDATSFRFYHKGILTKCISEQLDHGVLIVGLDKNNNPPYWIIKNSWGPNWGEDGYIRVAYGSNQCLINNYPTTSIIGSTPVPSNTTTQPGPSYTFIQVVCRDDVCSKGCSNYTIPLNKCVPTDVDGSFILQCTSTSVKFKHFSDSTNCSGMSKNSEMPLDQCVLQNQSEEYFVENFCIPVS